MTEEEFVATYCTNLHRQQLFVALKDKLRLAQDSLNPLRVVVYGSFVTEKDLPMDIDVLIFGDLIPEKWTSEPFQLQSSDVVHIKSTVRLPGPKPPLPEAAVMVAAFNEANQKNGIAVASWVPLDL